MRISLVPYAASQFVANMWLNRTNSVLLEAESVNLSSGALANNLGRAGGSVVWSSCGRIE